jgi:hypothetical protein
MDTFGWCVVAVLLGAVAALVIGIQADTHRFREARAACEAQGGTLVSIHGDPYYACVEPIRK